MLDEFVHKGSSNEPQLMPSLVDYSILGRELSVGGGGVSVLG